MNSVAEATTVLEKIRSKIGVKYLPYFLTPNAILGLGHMRTLSSVRIDSPTDSDKTALGVVLDLLNQDRFHCSLNEGKLASNSRPYVILSIHSLRQLSLLHTNPLLPLPEYEQEPADSAEKYLETIELDSARQKQKEAHMYPLAHLGVHWLLGLMLGYPVAAVASMPPFWEYEFEDGGFNKRVKKAKLSHAMDYFEVSDGTCIYDFPWFLSDNPEIVEHQEAWSNYFDTFYSSDWHRETTQESDFKATLQHARKIEAEEHELISEESQ